MIAVIKLLLIVLTAYFGFGLLFGIYFFVKGAIQVDPVLKESKWTVRLILVPGSIAMWPFLLIKLLKS